MIKKTTTTTANEASVVDWQEYLIGKLAQIDWKKIYPCFATEYIYIVSINKIIC